MNLKSVIWLFLFISNFALSSAHSPDSLWHISIQEITIEHTREHFFREDKKVYRPDSLQLNLYRNSSVGELLGSISPVYVNTYGSSGAVSGLILRGAGTSQSLVLWNGFPVNSISLGSADLSILPVCSFNNISLTYSAAGSIYSSGTFGGSLDLQYRPIWKKGIRLTLAPEAGSYGDRRISFSASGGTQNLQFQSTFLRQQGIYDFVFTDTYKYGSPRESMKNNALSNTLFIQNVFLKLRGNNQLEAGVWYQNKLKEIPAIMGAYSPGTAHQRDSVFRVYGKWKKLFKHSSLQISSAWFTDQMLYRDNYSDAETRYLIDSKIRNSRTVSDGFYRMYLGRHISLDGGAGISVLSAHVSNYGANMTELTPSLFAGMKFRNDFLVANLSARKEFHTQQKVNPLLSAGFRSTVLIDRLSVRGNYSDQFRVPTFNDKYWQPGGNPELIAEKGWTADGGFEYIHRVNSTSLLVLDLNAFYSGIHNLIQWLPQENGAIWTPVNTKYVISRGLEAGLNYKFVSPVINYNMHAGYTFNKSQIKATRENQINLTGNELIYRPNHLIHLFSNAEIKNFSLALNMNFIGKRYTTEDNNPVYAMPSHLLVNLYTGYTIKVRELSGTIQFRVNNLLDSQYQLIRSYAMPGRTYKIGIIFHFLTHKN